MPIVVSSGLNAVREASNLGCIQSAVGPLTACALDVPSRLAEASAATTAPCIRARRVRAGVVGVRRIVTPFVDPDAASIGRSRDPVKGGRARSLSAVAGVVVVTDSTAYLPAGLVERYGITVVPVQVVIGGESHDEGSGVSSDAVAQALRDWRPVTTSRPSPQGFLAAYRAAADGGADAVVSVHLSGEVSGTVSSAQLAAEESPVPVRVVDSRTLGMAMGFGVVSGAEAAAAGGVGRRGRARGGEAVRRDVRLLLRRHARVPASRRPDRVGCGVRRVGARGQAVAAHRGRPDRAAGQGANLGTRARAAGRARHGARR